VGLRLRIECRYQKKGKSINVTLCIVSPFWLFWLELVSGAELKAELVLVYAATLSLGNCWKGRRLSTVTRALHRALDTRRPPNSSRLDCHFLFPFLVPFPLDLSFHFIFIFLE